MNILMLHGINHNMFGKRDPKQYGTITLDQIDARLHEPDAGLWRRGLVLYTFGNASGIAFFDLAFDPRPRRPVAAGHSRRGGRLGAVGVHEFV